MTILIDFIKSRSYQRPFKKYHHKVTLRKGQELANIKRVLTEVINSKNLYGIYFRDKGLVGKFTLLCSALFDNSVKFVKCNILCKDLQDAESQNKVIKEYHINHNGIIET